MPSPHPQKGHKECTWQWVHKEMYNLYTSTINSLQTDIHSYNQISACHTRMPHAKAFGNQFVLEINRNYNCPIDFAIIIANWGEGLGRDGVNNTNPNQSGGFYQCIKQHDVDCVLISSSKWLW